MHAPKKTQAQKKPEKTKFIPQADPQHRDSQQKKY